MLASIREFLIVRHLNTQNSLLNLNGFAASSKVIEPDLKYDILDGFRVIDMGNSVDSFLCRISVLSHTFGFGFKLAQSEPFSI